MNAVWYVLDRPPLFSSVKLLVYEMASCDEDQVEKWFGRSPSQTGRITRKPHAKIAIEVLMVKQPSVIERPCHPKACGRDQNQCLLDREPVGHEATGGV